MGRRQLGGLLVVVAVAVVVGIVGYRVGTKGERGTTGQPETLPGKPYQAVFLTNGQVYFGKIVRRTTTEATVRDIYYLQVQQPIQPPPEGQTPQQQQQTQLSLVKLGNEIHKPRDELVINNDHILFIEDLQEDGQVVQAIRRFQRGEVSPAPPAETEKPETEKKKSEEKKSEETKPESEQP